MKATATVRSFLRTWSHLLKKSLMENFIFSAVIYLCMPEMFLVDKKTHVKFGQLSPLDKTHSTILKKICKIYM